MSPSIIHSPAAPFFFAAFGALPESGRLTVPVRMNAWTNALEARELTPQTVAPFASTLGSTITEIAREFPPRSPITILPCLGGAWTAMHRGAKHLLLENASEGKSLVFDRGAHLTRRLTGHMSGLALAVKRWGCFNSHEMSQALGLKHRMRWLPTAYEMKFEVVIRTDLDPALLHQGAVSEILAIDVYTLGPDQSLPPALRPYWNFSKTFSDLGWRESMPKLLKKFRKADKTLFIVNVSMLFTTFIIPRR